LAYGFPIRPNEVQLNQQRSDWQGNHTHQHT
jgi:hypothetical protein